METEPEFFYDGNPHLWDSAHAESMPRIISNNDNYLIPGELASEVLVLCKWYDIYEKKQMSEIVKVKDFGHRWKNFRFTVGETVYTYRACSYDGISIVFNEKFPQFRLNMHDECTLPGSTCTNCPNRAQIYVRAWIPEDDEKRWVGQEITFAVDLWEECRMPDGSTKWLWVS